MFKKMTKLLGLLGALLLLGSCSLPGLASNHDKNNISIIGGITTESQIMAAMISQLLEHDGNFETTLVNNLATTSIIHQALVNGDGDIAAARYTGTDLTTVLNQEPVTDPQKALSLVQAGFQEKFHQQYFPSYGFENSYVFLVTKETAEKYHLQKVSDLQNYADELSVGVDSSWLNRKGDGYPGFISAYDFSFAKTYPMQIGLVYDAVAAGQMDVILGYSTDGRIASYDLVMLEDDRHFFPPYDCAMVVNESLFEKHPEAEGILEKLTGKISTEEMQELNYQADNNLLEPAEVAKRFLESHNYFQEVAK
ncbi:osmoprotectant ABC transporter substrate-binding protein [Enterococcus timonensis]|uniref:osmoprotectant ABC transporter substrate-binding protein n=1 Tax=Enterococcus timonensis TaxID=1852364 RepID=UPI0008D97339|nr:osmoprotectant ABC transporter substrate-binding protein [Enterococcus timonensis]